MRTRKHIIEVPLPEREPRETGIEAPEIFKPKKQPARQPQEVPNVIPVKTPSIPFGNEGIGMGLQKG